MSIDQRAKPRIIIEGGMLQGVYFDNLDRAVSGIDVIKLDRDIDGHGDDDGITTINGEKCFFDVIGMEQASDDLGRDVGRAYLSWGLG